MKNFFKFKENGTKLSTEITAGITTFLAMSYIIFVNPSLLALSGMPSQAVFLATIFSSAIATLILGLFANVPYAVAPGMGLNAFFTYTVVFALGFTWQEALSMVFICGVVNIVITVTKVRKMLIIAIPVSLQHAISAGIGIFIGYIGIKNAGLLNFTVDGYNILSINGGDPTAPITNGIDSLVANSGTLPALVNFTEPGVLLAIIGLVITIVLLLKNVQGAILIGIVATTLLAIPMGLVDLSSINLADNSLASAFVNPITAAFEAL